MGAGDSFYVKSIATYAPQKSWHNNQTMTEAKHNWPIPKLLSNRPSASADEVFGPIIRPSKISLKIPFHLFLSLKEAKI